MSQSKNRISIVAFCLLSLASVVAVRRRLWRTNDLRSGRLLPGQSSGRTIGSSFGQEKALRWVLNATAVTSANLMRSVCCAGIASLLAFPGSSSNANTITTEVVDTFFYSSNFDALSDSSTLVFIDARSSEDCRAQTLADAVCLAPTQLVHPDGTLASMRDINWLFGALGIDETATAVVFGNKIPGTGYDADSHFVASIVFLLGQARVSIWNGDIDQLFDHQNRMSGAPPSVLRQHFFGATMRDAYLSLDSDVRQFFSTASVERLPLTAFPETEVYVRADGARLVVARNPRQALISFARLMATPTGAEPEHLRVHAVGMGDRSTADFGAPRPFPRHFVFAAFAVVSLTALVGFFQIRRR